MPRFPASLYLVWLLFGSCTASLPRVDTPAAEPEALVGYQSPMPGLLGNDEVNRKTDRQLAAVGANNLDALKPADHGAMQQPVSGAAHGGGTGGHAGHGASTTMPAMDHGEHTGSPAAQSNAPSHQHH